MKRQDYISWDEYFMGVALLAAKRSKDPNTQVGACIVDCNNIILSTGTTAFLTVVRMMIIRGTERAMTQSTTMLSTPNSMRFLMQEDGI